MLSVLLLGLCTQRYRLSIKYVIETNATQVLTVEFHPHCKYRLYRHLSLEIQRLYRLFLLMNLELLAFILMLYNRI